MLSHHHHHPHGGDDDELTPRGPDAGLARAADKVESVSWTGVWVWRVGVMGWVAEENTGPRPNRRLPSFPFSE